MTKLVKRNEEMKNTIETFEARATCSCECTCKCACQTTSSKSSTTTKGLNSDKSTYTTRAKNL